MIFRSISSLALFAIFFFVGCSAWDGGYKGGAPPNVEDMQGKSITGVYRDLGLDGSIKFHPVRMGIGGQTTGIIKVGGPAPIPDLRTGEMVIKGGSNNSSTPGSPQDNTGGSKGNRGDTQ